MRKDVFFRNLHQIVKDLLDLYACTRYLIPIGTECKHASLQCCGINPGTTREILWGLKIVSRGSHRTLHWHHEEHYNLQNTHINICSLTVSSCTQDPIVPGIQSPISGPLYRPEVNKERSSLRSRSLQSCFDDFEPISPSSLLASRQLHWCYSSGSDPAPITLVLLQWH